MQDQLYGWLQELVPQIQSVPDAEDKFLKFAEDKNLSPALLEKLGHMYNISLTLHVREKSANAGLEFQKLDPERLLDRYTSFDPAKAAAAPDLELPVDGSSERVHMDFPKGRMTYIDDTPSSLKVASENTEPTYFDKVREQERTEVWLKNARELRETYRRELEQACKKAFDVLTERYPNGLDAFPTMEADAVAYSKGVLKSACDTLSEYLGVHTYHVKRAEESNRKRIVWRENTMAPELERIKEADANLEALCTMIKGAEETKEAQGATAASPWVSQQAQSRGAPPPIVGAARPPAPSDTKEEEASPKAQAPSTGTGGYGGDVLEMLLGATPSISPVMPRAQPYIDEALRRDGQAVQKALDKAHDDAKAQSVLETIMATDPVVGTADPEIVVSYAQSILNTDPQAARDYNVMRFALREALAQSGIDPQMRDVMIGGRKNRAQAEESEQKATDSRYANA